MHANPPLFSKSLLIQGWNEESGAPPHQEVEGFEQEKPPLPPALDARGPLRFALPPEGPEGRPTRGAVPIRASHPVVTACWGQV